MLILPISEDLNKLLQYRRLTSIASLSVSCRVVIMTEDLSVMLIIAILCSKDSWTDRTREVLNMVFSVQRGDIRPTERRAALKTQKIKATKVINFTQGVLAVTLLIIQWKEF